MAKYKGIFRCVVLSPKGLVFEGEIESLFIKGDCGEYELMAYHYPLIGLVRRGDLIVNWEKRIPIRGGIVRFFANECNVLVEEEIQHKQNKDDEEEE